MIYDKLDNISLYFGSDSVFAKAVEFAKNFKGENGKVYLDGEKLYASISEYTTAAESQKVFEAHRKYIDVQILLSGKEMLGVMPLDMKNMTETEKYDLERDVAFYQSRTDYSKVVLAPGEFVIFYPGDCHKPGCSLDSDKMVRKIVVKVAV